MCVCVCVCLTRSHCKVMGNGQVSQIILTDKANSAM